MNPKQTKQIVIGAILVVVLLFVIWFQFFRAGSTPPPPAGNKAAKAEKAGKSAKATKGKAEDAEGPRSRFQEDINLDELLAQVRDVDFDYDLVRAGRNPMMPLVGVSFVKTQQKGSDGASDGQLDFETMSYAQRMRLTGIIWDAAEPMAVLDNVVVGIGYQFPNGIVVESMTEDQVVLNVKGTKITKELNKEQ